ncbi:MAG: cupin domain-containing protein [Candidatus Thermoplasmatota archaeon]|nr:cupin domain-containing protein [Candidatus Thermoplasmatota archaeon]
MSARINDKPILVKKDDGLIDKSRQGKKYQLKLKSDKMEAIIAELDPHTESRWFKHSGQEIHIVLNGEMEYAVGDNFFKLCEGDILWHDSSKPHRAKNNSDKKVKYITIGTPPTFMMDDI